jgi:hypothetical protein
MLDGVIAGATEIELGNTQSKEKLERNRLMQPIMFTGSFATR